MKNTKFERVFDIQQLSIDCLPYRKGVNKRKRYYDQPHHVSGKSKHVRGYDYHDQARQLATFNLRALGSKWERVAYVLIDGKMIRLRTYKTALKRARVKFVENNNYIVLASGEYHEIIITSKDKLSKYE